MPKIDGPWLPFEEQNSDKPFSAYSSAERMEVVASISRKMNSGQQLDDREKAFREWQKYNFGEENQSQPSWKN